MKWLKFFCLFLVLPAFLPAQTGAMIEELLETKAVTYEQAAQLVLEAADLEDYSSDSSKAEAFDYAVERNWFPLDAEGWGAASLQGVSLLIMQAFGFKGGLFYTMGKSPHYAYRELVYQEVIQGRVDPQMAVSGEMLLFMVGRVLERLEE
jgi:hypothetical protein